MDKAFIIKVLAYAYGYFLSSLLLKYLCYDNECGSVFSIVFLLAGLFYARIYLSSKRSERLSEGVCLILFILFDTNLLNLGNVFLLFGVAVVREHLHDNFDKKEIASFVCGLIYLLMGWHSVGRVLVIYSLLLFYLGTVMNFVINFVVTSFIQRIKDDLASLKGK